MPRANLKESPDNRPSQRP